MSLKHRIKQLEIRKGKIPPLVLNCLDEPDAEQQQQIDAAVSRGQLVVLFRERGDTCRLYLPDGEVLDG